MASMSDNGLVLSGYQKKLKTMKKKFFVLYKDTTNNAARLEYYDTEKKFIQRAEPKRVIYLKSCFNINRRTDTKHQYVLGLSSREGGFGIVLNSENDLKKWLDNLLSIQRDNAIRSDQAYIPYEYVWQVVVQRKGMSESARITGSYHCCLRATSLTFKCMGSEKLPNGEDRLDNAEILLTTIRCGHASPQSIFYMELGRQSALGSGELWMETEDATIAKKMHDKILQAMSAKTESNMNLLNVYKGKSDLSNEPMRKRSSSATEASKPINVLHKRQNPIEIRNSFSPQYISYGRERCDSLPTRNRTLSECSNQTYSALKHGHRCNTISGSRPYAAQRHSDSPPMTTPMKCSESEESSVSIDEADDKDMFDAYRINSRSSKGVIPEENLDDDLVVVDNSKMSRINENFENYISMTPIKSTYENVNANHVNHCIGSNALIGVADEDLNFTFPEHSPEKLPKDADVDNQFERPMRAYSIGSKVEHTKLSKVLGNLNEVDNSSTRVRAYSVGSKSKIPRCDIQRGVLVSKGKKGHKGSHFNVSVDMAAYNDVVGFNTPREIKSTSAPLLNPKYYINSDRMSDLMEIDFSNPVSTPSSNTLLAQPQKSSTKNFQVANLTQPTHIPPNPYSMSYGNIKQMELQRQEESPYKYPTTKSVEPPTDNGYLEMKPVGIAPINSKQNTSLEDQILKLRLQNSAIQVPPSQPMDISNSNDKSPTQGSISPHKHIRSFRMDRKLENRPPDTSTELSKAAHLSTNIENLKSPQHQHQTEENTKLENKCENTLSNFAATVGRKLIHSISNEDYSKNMNKPHEAGDSKDVGYQILQIKSDSSLISKKKNQRPIYKPQCGRQFLLEGVNNADEKVLKSIAHPNTSLNNKLIAATDLKESKLEALSNKDENELASSAGHCEQGLYYASLDLPQSSGQITSKSLKNASCESPPVAVSLDNRSSYAKIDFDQSDSSSASSKIFNV
ncbi:hypothetical protein KR093_011526 [Drosophila rubida]|uniref:Insulin receptor substrate 1 n=1 Tax=Drosophila rubida TaxID=30044 RepID=A0AAD4K6P5_9MUSC|nr:hypothetical protein KR093_011526 [Drosophila rubida]